MSNEKTQSNVEHLPVPARKSVLVAMADRYGMEPAAFEQTLRATVFPKAGTKEEFAAFLLVAKEYDLNPLLQQIYAFPKKGGGIQPIVPIDGWADIINSNPQLDGIEFDDHHEGDDLTAVTARIWRKDRSKPVVVTEYLVECKRATETWKQWPRRMLRHKALIQCARYAFGLAGIVDPDEAERIGVSDMKDITPVPPEPTPPPPDIKPEPPEPAKPKAKGKRTAKPYAAKTGDGKVIDADPETGEIIDDAEPFDPAGWLEALDLAMGQCKTLDEVESIWSVEGMVTIESCIVMKPDREKAEAVHEKHMARFEAAPDFPDCMDEAEFPEMPDFALARPDRRF